MWCGDVVMILCWWCDGGVVVWGWSHGGGGDGLLMLWIGSSMGVGVVWRWCYNSGW